MGCTRFWLIQVASHLRVSVFSFQLLSKAGFAVFIRCTPRCATAPTAWPLQNDCGEVKFNVKAAGVMLERQVIRLSLWISIFDKVWICWYAVLGNGLWNPIIFYLTDSLDGCWMNHWPIQSEAEPNAFGSFKNVQQLFDFMVKINYRDYNYFEPDFVNSHWIVTHSLQRPQ